MLKWGKEEFENNVDKNGKLVNGISAWWEHSLRTQLIGQLCQSLWGIQLWSEHHRGKWWQVSEMRSWGGNVARWWRCCSVGLACWPAWMQVSYRPQWWTWPCQQMWRRLGGVNEPSSTSQILCSKLQVVSLVLICGICRCQLYSFRYVWALRLKPSHQRMPFDTGCPRSLRYWCWLRLHFQLWLWC